MSHNAKRSTAAQSHENTNAAMQQVENRKNGSKPTSAPTNPAPAPEKVVDLEAHLAEFTTELSKAKKASKKSDDNLTKVRERYDHQLYEVAVAHMLLGTASAEEMALISSRKAEENANTGLAKFFAKEYKDSDEVAKAWEALFPEFGSLTSAIAETYRLWGKGFCTLYKSIGITAKKQLTVDLVKGLCPFIQVATADGLKAAIPSRRAVRKNGKAVKKNGKKVYKYTLRAVKGWTAKNLFKVLELNYRMTTDAIFTEDEQKARLELLDTEYKALKALKDAAALAKKAKEQPNEVVPEQAAEAAKAADKLKDAAKAAGQKSKENAAAVGSKETKVA